MSYKIVNNDGNECKYVDLPNGSTITCGNKQYKIQDGSIFCYELQNGKITGQGKIVTEIYMSKEQISVFGEIAKNDNYTDRFDREDLSIFGRSELKETLKNSYGQNTNINKARTSGKSIKYEVEPDYDNKAEYYLKKVGNFFRRIAKKEEKPILERQEKDIVEVELGKVQQNKKTIKTIKYKEKEYTYNVKDGCSLESISLETDVPLKKIQYANPDLWTMKPLMPEDKIKIPANGDNTKKTKYTITADETWESIAEKYNINVSDLKLANKKYIETINEPQTGTSIIIPEHKHKTKVKESNVETIPEQRYQVSDTINLQTIANNNNISLYRLIQANPDLVLKDNQGNPRIDANGNILCREIKKGEQLIIPAHKQVTKVDELSVKGIAEQVGISALCIKSIIMQNVGENMEPVLQLQKSKKASDTLRIGFGHRGNVHGTSPEKSLATSDVTITKEEAYQLLANDLYSAKEDAITYFGQNFEKAPQEIQDTIIKLILDNGINALENNDMMKQLKQDITNGDYSAAAANAIGSAMSSQANNIPTTGTKETSTKPVTKTKTKRTKTETTSTETAKETKAQTLNKTQKNNANPEVAQIISKFKGGNIDISEVKDMSTVATYTGISEDYIREILVGIEGHENYPLCEAEYDHVAGRGHPKGYLTMGFGHTALAGVPNPEEGMTISVEQAYQILANDIINSKKYARNALRTSDGRNLFDEAPKSIQNALIDLSFNKGPGEVKDEHLVANLKVGFYGAASRRTWYNTNTVGLQKRNMYRFLESIKDISNTKKYDAIRIFYGDHSSQLTRIFNKDNNAKSDWNSACNKYGANKYMYQ